MNIIKELSKKRKLKKLQKYQENEQSYKTECSIAIYGIKGSKYAAILREYTAKKIQKIESDLIKKGVPKTNVLLSYGIATED